MAKQTNTTNTESTEKPVIENLAWFVLSTRSGHEKKVADNITQRIRANGMDDYIPEVLVPTQQRIVAKEGKKRTVEERLFPGYILVRMQLNEDTWHLVRNTEGVTGFVGQTKEPEPIPQSQVDAILAYGAVEQTSYKTSFAVGDAVKVTDGPFKDLIGEVTEINEAKGQLTVLLSMFDREVPTQLDFLQVASL
jgi:transcriptional antiterminator NusG